MKKIALSVGGLAVIAVGAVLGVNYYANSKLLEQLNEINNSTSLFRLEWAQAKGNYFGTSSIKDVKIFIKQNNKLIAQIQNIDFVLTANGKSFKTSDLSNIQIGFKDTVTSKKSTALIIDSMHQESNANDTFITLNNMHLVSDKLTLFNIILANLSYQESSDQSYKVTYDLKGFDFKEQQNPLNPKEQDILNKLKIGLLNSKAGFVYQYDNTSKLDNISYSINMPDFVNATLSMGIANIDGVADKMQSLGFENQELAEQAKNQGRNILIFNRMNRLGLFSFAKNNAIDADTLEQFTPEFHQALIESSSIKQGKLEIKDLGLSKFIVDNDLYAIGKGKNSDQLMGIYKTQLNEYASNIQSMCAVYLQQSLDCEPLVKFIKLESPTITASINPPKALNTQDISALFDALSQTDDAKNIIKAFGLKLLN